MNSTRTAAIKVIKLLRVDRSAINLSAHHCKQTTMLAKYDTLETGTKAGHFLKNGTN